MMLLDNIRIVLVRPRVPENIGSAIRVAYNFGINSVVLVRDEMPEYEKMAKTATHNAMHLLDSMPRYNVGELDKALQDCNLVVAATARRGKKRFAEQTPRQAVELLHRYLMNNQVAILFGPEDSGLSNEELQYVQIVSTIPTGDFSSLNLAQAVGIYCYELYQEIGCGSADFVHKKTLATSYERESMFAVLEEALSIINFFDEAGRPRWVANIRNFLGRMELESRDANLIRGICKKFIQSQ